MNVRTRFAPSPTGLMHVGGIRTALFAWLIARQANGKFILRLEDTDQKREMAGADQHIINCLHALGLDYDEGPDIGGDYGPYRQSKRLDIYKTWGQKLIDSGRAYSDPYTPAEVQAFREQAQKERKPFLYRNHRPKNTPKWDGSTPLRFKSEPKAYAWHDEVMGDLRTGPEVVDDFILIKSDGYPTYNFAHIVDDAQMQITHIIRGQEFIASVPNYLNLYEVLQLEPPIMATMPHILNEQGNKKLSKRDGSKDVLDYIKEGYLPEALRSYIATLGWNDGTEQEIFSTEELIQKFSLNRVQKSGAHFDEKRLDWVNGHFIRALSLDDLYTMVSVSDTVGQKDAKAAEDTTFDFWPTEAKNADESYKKQVLGLVQERLKYFAELSELTHFFFSEPMPNPDLITSNKQLKKLKLSELKNLLELTVTTFEKSNFKTKDIQEKLNHLLEETGQKPAVLFSIIRIATTWAVASPQLDASLGVLGKQTVLGRLKVTIELLNTLESYV